jgi:hypothetical protein
METPNLKTHDREVRRLWKICILLASLIFFSTSGATLLMLRLGVEGPTVLVASTLFFQIVVVSYGMAFFVPAFLTSLKKLSLSIRMGFQSLDMAKETVEAVKEVRSELRPVVDDLKYVTEQAKPVVDRLNKAVVEDGILERAEEHMRIIRERVERDTKPIGIKTRPEYLSAGTKQLAATAGGDDGEERP